MSMIELQKKIGVTADGAFGPGTLKAAAAYYKLSPNRAAHFFAQTAHESGGFKAFSENLNYSAARLCQVWPSRFVIPTSAAARACTYNPEALANTVYGGRLGNVKQGDGWLFHGRGLIQLTGRENYQALATALGQDVADMPAFLATQSGAATGACWFWTSNSLNSLADGWRLTDITKRINGGTNALSERVRLANLALAIFS